MKPRLHVLLARSAPVGLVLRRGPSKSVAAIQWNRATDQFTLGQWLRGRIYEKRSDLSPDGKHLIYFAMNGKWSSPTAGAWTAISRAPYLRAIALFAKGDCWHGGGLFVDNKTYWLNDGYGHKVLDSTTEVARAAPARAPRRSESPPAPRRASARRRSPSGPSHVADRSIRWRHRVLPVPLQRLRCPGTAATAPDAQAAGRSPSGRARRGTRV